MNDPGLKRVAGDFKHPGWFAMLTLLATEESSARGTDTQEPKQSPMASPPVEKTMTSKVKSARCIINVAGPYMLTQGELMNLG